MKYSPGCKFIKDIKRLYEEENCSISEIARKMDSYDQKISKVIKEFDFSRKYDDLEWLKTQYIISNKSVKNIAAEFKISENIVRNRVKKFGLIKTPEKRKEARNRNFKDTCRRKYGVENPFQLGEVKNKAKETCMEKYGVTHPMKSDEVRESVEKTNLSRYGYKTSLMNDEVRAKGYETIKKRYGTLEYKSSPDYIENVKKRNQELYGVDFFFQSEDFKEKSEETNLKRYGVKNWMSSEDNVRRFIEKRAKENGIQIDKAPFLNNGKNIKIFEDKTLAELCREYNIPYNTFNAWLNRQKKPNSTLIREYISSYSSNLTGIEFEMEKILGIKRYNKKFDKSLFPELNYKPDFKLNDNTALNVDGLYWHSELNQKDNRYHFNMRRDFEENGLRILQFRENEIRDKRDIINSMILNLKRQVPNRIGARKTSLKQVLSADAKNFLNKNHIKGYIAAKHIGLYYGEELISILSFKITNGTLKVDRFCSKANWSIAGGFSKLLSYLKRNFKYDLVYYWVDLRYGTGRFLLSLGFKEDRNILSWEWTDTYSTFNRRRCMANMDSRRLSESAHAKELGWCKIYDAGQRLYVL